MATLVLSIRGESPALLASALNAALAPLLANQILAVDFDVGDATRVGGVELIVTITYTDAGVVQAAPFQAVLFDARNPTELASLAQATIAAGPLLFWSPVFAGYIGSEGRRTSGYIGMLLRCTDLVNATANWFAGGSSAPAGPAGGDLFGMYPNPGVGGIRGIPVSAAAPSGGDTFVYDAVAGQWVPAPAVRYFASGAAAQAAAPFINGTFVVIYPGTPPSEAGTWQVTANQGAAFPADYTKVSDATETASEVGIVDAGNYYAGTNVEDALQEIGAGLISGPTGALAVGLNVLDTIAATAAEGAEWEVLLESGILRYQTVVTVAHDGATATATETAANPGPGVGVLPVTFDADISGANLRLLATAAAPGWSFRVRRLAALVV